MTKKEIDKMFELELCKDGCYKINNILLSDDTQLHFPTDYDGTPIKEISIGLFSLKNVKEVYVPEGYRYMSVCDIYDDALESIYFSFPKSMKTIARETFSCFEKMEIEFPNGNDRYALYDGNLVDRYTNTLLKLNSSTIPHIKEINTIGYGSIIRKKNTKEVIELPENITRIDADLFKKYEKRPNVKLIPSKNNRSFSYMNNCLIDNKDFTLIKAYENPECDVLDLTFYPFKKLGNGSLSNLKSYKNIIFPSTLIQIGNKAFEGSNFTSIIMPDSILKLGTDLFNKCENLKEIKLPKYCIENHCFEFWYLASYNLKKIEYPYFFNVDSSQLKIAKDTKFPILNSSNVLRIQLLSKHYDTLKIPKEYDEIRFEFVDFNVTIDNLIFEANVHSLEFPGSIIKAKNIKFLQKSDNYLCRNGTVYDKKNKCLVYLNVAKNMKNNELIIPNFIKNIYDNFIVDDDKNVTKIAINHRMNYISKDSLIEPFRKLKECKIKFIPKEGIHEETIAKAKKEFYDRKPKIILEEPSYKRLKVINGVLVNLRSGYPLAILDSNNFVLYSSRNARKYFKKEVYENCPKKGRHIYIGNSYRNCYFDGIYHKHKNSNYLILKGILNPIMIGERLTDKVSTNFVFDRVTRDIETSYPFEFPPLMKMKWQTLYTDKTDAPKFIHITKGVIEINPYLIKELNKGNYFITIDKENKYFELKNGKIIEKER